MVPAENISKAAGLTVHTNLVSTSGFLCHRPNGVIIITLRRLDRDELIEQGEVDTRGRVRVEETAVHIVLQNVPGTPGAVRLTVARHKPSHICRGNKYNMECYIIIIMIQRSKSTQLFGIQ